MYFIISQNYHTSYIHYVCGCSHYCLGCNLGDGVTERPTASDNNIGYVSIETNYNS